MSLPIQKSVMKIASLLIQKLAAKLCRCRFRNWQLKTVSLPIQRSTAKNCVATDSEIDSQKPCCCRFRNRQRWWSHFSFTSLSFFFVFTIMDGDIIQLKCDIKVISLVWFIY
jgi:hypothetical protein